MSNRALENQAPLPERCTLVIASHLDELRAMSAWLESGLRALGAPDELRFHFDLCANEAVANIMSYAYPQGGEHQIALQLTLQDSTIRLQIEDDGMPFNPLARPPHVQPASLEAAAIGGLGIDLMRSLMEECNYTRVNTRNILTLAARLPATHQSTRPPAASG